MKIGIIGSGNIGKSIGSWAAKVGYEVTFSAEKENDAKDVAKLSGNGAKWGTVREAVQQSEIVLLAVPYDAAKAVLSDISPLLKGKVLIDVTNALTSDMSDLQVGHTTSGAEEIAKLVPDARVVKAFNTILAQVYASQNPRVHGTVLSVFLAGDDTAAKLKVSELATKMGFDVVDTGPLKIARFIEPVGMLNIHLAYGKGMGTEIGFGFIHPASAQTKKVA